MAHFWEIKRRSSYQTALELKKILPELKNTNSLDIEDNLRSSGIYLVQIDTKLTPWWIRLTLPFGLIFLIFLFITLPIKFMFTGTWMYNWIWLNNWFSALKFL